MWMLARCRVLGLSRTASTALSGAWNVGVVRVLVLSVRCWVLREHAVWCCFKPQGLIPSSNQSSGWVARCLSSGSGFWLFFENYTVDASIFVVKL